MRIFFDYGGIGAKAMKIGFLDDTTHVSWIDETKLPT